MDAFECPFSLHARKQPHKAALLWGNKSWSYLECHYFISKIENTIRQIGGRKGQSMGIYPSPTFPFPLLFFACFRLGIILCPLSLHVPPSSNQKLLDRIKASFVLLPENISKQLFPKQMALSLSSICGERSKNIFPSSPFLLKKNLALYLATSGTTAEAKIAALSLGNLYYNALGSNGTLPALNQTARYLLSLPLYHVSGIAILFRSFLAGATVVLPEKRSLSIDELITKKVTHLSFVPTQLQRLLEANSTQIALLSTQLRCILLGGAPIPPSLYKNSIESGLKVYPTYGMTEMSSQITTATDCLPSSRFLGHPLPYRELRIEKNGDIWVKGKTLFIGYFHPKFGVEDPKNAAGFFETQDIGKYSVKNGLVLLGRKDRLFISGGENIHPEEIEQTLTAIEGILDAHVTPIADKEFGFRPIAYIESKRSFPAKQLQEILATTLPKYKIPIHFLPMISNQKKKELRF